MEFIWSFHFNCYRLSFIVQNGIFKPVPKSRPKFSIEYVILGFAYFWRCCGRQYSNFRPRRCFALVMFEMTPQEEFNGHADFARWLEISWILWIQNQNIFFFVQNGHTCNFLNFELSASYNHLIIGLPIRITFNLAGTSHQTFNRQHASRLWYPH